MEIDVSPAKRVDLIHTELDNMVGQRIRVRANMGRSRIVERVGTLYQTYPALFVIEVEERRGRKARQSYQYVDVLTGTVELYDFRTGERLLEFAEEE
ncbi:MAG: Veg family protein [Coriobacteriales bacterium]|nr:Veg family protein [Coriobacteriales bacterium]